MPAQNSGFIFKVRDQDLEFIKLAWLDPSVIGQVRDQRCQAPIKPPIQKALAGLADALLAADSRGVKIASAAATGLDRPLVEQAIEQRLDRTLAPVRAAFQLVDQLTGRGRMLLPKAFHDFSFGIGDMHDGQTVYICRRLNDYRRKRTCQAFAEPSC